MGIRSGDHDTRSRVPKEAPPHTEKKKGSERNTIKAYTEKKVDGPSGENHQGETAGKRARTASPGKEGAEATFIKTKGWIRNPEEKRPRGHGPDQGQ